jgi:hypothetical protein
MLVVSLTGLLRIMDNAELFGKTPGQIGSLWGSGGLLGFTTFGQTPTLNFGLALLGSLGASIVYTALCLISLLFLTNFQLGEWIRATLDRFQQAKAGVEKTVPKSAEEIAKIREDLGISGQLPIEKDLPMEDVDLAKAEVPTDSSLSPTEVAQDPSSDELAGAPSVARSPKVVRSLRKSEQAPLPVERPAVKPVQPNRREPVPPKLSHEEPVPPNR